MPISYYAGKPRHGKSYSVMHRVVIPALKAGRNVVTNIPVLEPALQLPGKVHQLQRGKQTMRDIANMLLLDKDDTTGDYLPNMEFAGAVFVLDEFMFLCSSGVKTAAIDDKVKAFFAMHGHVSASINGHSYSTEIVLMSQDASQICSMVKAMIDQSFLIEKTMIGSKKMWNAKIYSGCVGVNTGAAKACYLRTEQGSYDAEVFPFYKSQTLGESHGDETKTDDATNLMNLKSFKYILPASLVLLPLMIWFAVRSFASLFGADPVESSVPVSQTLGEPSVFGGPSAAPMTQPKQILPPKPEPEPPAILRDVTFFTAGGYAMSGKVTNFYKLVPKEGDAITLTEQELAKLGVQVMHFGESAVLVAGDYKQLLFPWTPPEPEAVQPDFEPLAQGVKSAF